MLLLTLLLLNRDTLAENGSPYELCWKRLTRSPATALAWDDSLLWIGTGEGTLVAVGRSDGVRRWEQRGHGPLRQPLALAGAQLLLADAWGRVEAIEAHTGTPIWSAARLGWGEAQIAVQDGLLFVGSGDGWLYALYTADGSPRWRLYTGARLPSMPWVAQGLLYTGARPGQLLEVDALTGVRLRQTRTEAPVVAGPVEVSGRLVVGCDDGYVRAFRQKNLDLVWAQRLGAPLQTAPLIAGDRLVCLAGNGWVYGLDPEAGGVKWKHSLGGKGSGPLVPGPTGEVLAATDRGRILALDPRTGRLLWEQQVLEAGGLYLQAAGEWLFAGAGDGYLYAFSRKSPAAALPDTAWEDWWEIYDQGHKTGYAHQVVRADPFQGIDAWRFFEERVSWRSGWVRHEHEAWVDRAWRPLFSVERRIEERQVLEIRAAWQDSEVYVEQQLGDRIMRQVVQAEAGATLSQVALFKLAQEGRLQGQDSVRVFDPTSASTGTLYFSFENGETDSLRVARVRADRESVVEVVRWLDAQGRQVRAQAPLLGSEQVRVEAGRARAWALPGVDKLVYLDQPVRAPAQVERLVLELPSFLVASLLVQDERQQVVEGFDQKIRLVVQQPLDRDPVAVPLPIQDPALVPFLQPSLYVQSDDERIRELARQLRGPERDAWKVALRLQRWISDRMVPTETPVRFKSALEVLDELEGNCSEYTALLLALCRAAGIPARACAGFVISPSGLLIPHLWVQVYTGRWMGLDPTWDQAELDAAHIQLSHGDLSPAELGRLNGPVELFMAWADTLPLVEYATEKERFLGEAERLFVQAEKAERAFEDTLAQALYQQIAFLPWNHRSGEIRVRLGRAHLQQGRFAEAEQVFSQLLEEQEAGQALFYLGRIAEAQGDTALALKRLEQVVKKHPDDELADEALGQLAQLRQHSGGCRAALPYYERLREEYGQSGWALVAQGAIERCQQQENAPTGSAAAGE